MFKVIATVLAFTAFLVFAPESRADAGPQEDSAPAPLVTIDWF
jgi:hypothetical protein